MTPRSSDTDLGPLVDRLRPNLRRILCGFRIPPHDADDVLQEVLLAALSQWESIDNLEAWILGTLRKRCAVYWRRRQTSILEAVDSELLELLAAPQSAPQERQALVWDLEGLIETLSARHRAVLWLRFGLGLDAEEVAQRLGYSQASIRQLIGRSLKRMRTAVLAGRARLPAAVSPISEIGVPGSAAAAKLPEVSRLRNHSDFPEPPDLPESSEPLVGATALAG